MCITPKWKAPPSGHLKLNFDGNWNGERKLGCFGLIIRDDSGVFVTASCGNEPDNFTSLQAKVVAVRFGLIWAMNRGFTNFLYESNWFQIVEALRDSSTTLSYIGQVVEDIKFLYSSVMEVPFTHIRC